MKSIFVNLFVALTLLGSSLTFCGNRERLTPIRSPNRGRNASVSPAPGSRTPMKPAVVRSPSPSPLLSLFSQNQPGHPASQQCVQKIKEDLKAPAKGLNALAEELSKLEKQENDLRNQEMYNATALEESLTALDNKLAALPQPQQEGYNRQTNNLQQRLLAIRASINHQKMLTNRDALEKIGLKLITLQRDKEKSKQQTPLSSTNLQVLIKANKAIETDLLAKANNNEYLQKEWSEYERNLLKRLSAGQEKLFGELEELQKAATVAHNQRQVPPVPTFDSKPAPTATPVVVVQPAVVQPPVVVPSISSPFKIEHFNQRDVAPAGSFFGSPDRPVGQQPLAGTISETVLLTPGIGSGFKKFPGTNQVDLSAKGSVQGSPMPPATHTALASLPFDKAPSVDEAKKASWFSLLRALAKKHWKKATVGTLALLALAGGEVKYKLLTKLGTRLFHGASLTAPATHAVAIAAQPQASWLTRNFGWITQLFFRGA